MLTNLKHVWDLESIFPGGSESPQLAAYIEEISRDIDKLAKDVQAKIDDWPAFVERMQNLGGRLSEAGAFIGCLNAQNVKDTQAKLLAGKLQQLRAAYGSVQTSVDRQLLAIPNQEWQELLKDLAPLAFNLEERRQWAADEMPEAQEKLANDLAVDGYHGWSDLYNIITGRMQIPFKKDGKDQELSVGQAQNVFSDADPEVRHAMAEKWEQAWSKEAELCAGALNHLAGFRLNLYRHRGWDKVLKEPLEYNRMSNATLDAMWSTIDANKDIFVKYLERKGKLLGLEKLGWFDLHAPVGKSAKTYSYDEGATFVMEQFGKVSPKMAAFAEKAFRNSWVEVEDRSGKRQGAFCTSLPMSGQTRVFMTYSGSANSVSTLAHELGHAFHQSVMTDLPLMCQRYAMNVAETASTFAEMVVADAAVQNATSKDEKIALLGGKVGNSISFFMDIHSRFLFETSFYEARRRGPVSVDQLNDLMLTAQKQAFRDSLNTWHPHFWCSKLHFYITAVPFYNFPYTFGYLFSAGVYAMARQEGKNFEQKYVDLLRDTGRMRVEDLAQRHLGVDLTKADFWQQAVDLAVADAQEFLDLTE
ncbi:MAG: M3 family oligoendopeptidase [Firmicutes bacterium]|nr:M3 family oligoendopeptidase [Bacillota bacterium]